MNRRDFLTWATALAIQATRDPPAPTVPIWALDVDGNGTVNIDDRRAIEASLGAARGFSLRPNSGYDFRADLLGRGMVTSLDLEVFDSLARPGPIGPRPIVLCWHYGWYHPQRRVLEPTTTTYLGGDYNSDDPAFEDEFNALKTEFGITVDMLSWIDSPADDPFDPAVGNYERGYFRAPSLGSRKFGWLYETAINLRLSSRATLGSRSGRRQRLVDNFSSMAREMLDPASGAIMPEVLLIDGRPVIYMFASHLLGTNLSSLVDVAISLGRARNAFLEVAGVPPYLIGDETLFIGDRELAAGRRLRSTFFDAVTRYHHYESGVVADFASSASVRMGGDYLDVVVRNEVRNVEAFEGTINRFTGLPLLVIPSSAAGFAKPGSPTLHASRDDYARLLREMLTVTEKHIARTHADRLGTPALPAPLVIVGSWNEEFEGHALFPSSFNSAMVGEGMNGFEWLFALKDAFGWNHYAGRSSAS